jgi:hypothetical protein
MMSGIASIYQVRGEQERIRARSEGCSEEEARRRGEAEQARAVKDVNRDVAALLLGAATGMAKRGPVGLFTGMFGAAFNNLKRS